MKRIVITVDDKLAQVVASLLIDQSVSFSFEDANAGLTLPASRRHRRASPQIKPTSAIGVILASTSGLGLSPFKASGLGGAFQNHNLTVGSISSVLSRMVHRGLLARGVDPHTFVVTQKGQREAERLK